jgi:hypothetical protein
VWNRGDEVGDGDAGNDQGDVGVVGNREEYGVTGGSSFSCCLAKPSNSEPLARDLWPLGDLGEEK